MSTLMKDDLLDLFSSEENPLYQSEPQAGLLYNETGPGAPCVEKATLDPVFHYKIFPLYIFFGLFNSLKDEVTRNVWFNKTDQSIAFLPPGQIMQINPHLWERL